MCPHVTPFSSAALRLDPAAETARIGESVRQQVFKDLRRRGVVIGLSGGVDSSVTACLCARALGKDRVLGLLMPEGESCPESVDLAQKVAGQLGISTSIEDITPVLEAAGCYRRRDEAIRLVIRDWGPGYRCKLVTRGIADAPGYTLFSIVIESPEGVQTKARLNSDALLGIVAATNFKQRTRKMFEYHYADRFQFAVAGTPNRLEHGLGFFVKNGDGAADLKPIAHLYKSQVYQLAEYLGVPEEIRIRPPSSDTFPLPQTQEEFYFALPYEKMDLCLYGWDHGLPAEEIAEAVSLSAKQVQCMYDDIKAKQGFARYLHRQPMLVESI